MIASLTPCGIFPELPEINKHPPLCIKASYICFASLRMTSCTYVFFSSMGPSLEKARRIDRCWLFRYLFHSFSNRKSFSRFRFPNTRILSIIKFETSQCTFSTFIHALLYHCPHRGYSRSGSDKDTRDVVLWYPHSALD